MIKFSIIIPVYNEEKNIEKLVNEIYINLKKYKNQFEVIVVNDGSLDKSFTILQNLSIKYQNFHFYSNHSNFGQSFSICEGIKRSNSDVIVTLDGDGQNNPADIGKLIDLFDKDEKLYLVGGIRTKRKDNWIKILSSRFANFVRKLILNDRCDDTGCSLKVFYKKTFLEFPFFDGLHRFLPALFAGYGKKTLFVSVDHRTRVYGNSKYGTLDRLYKGVRDLIKVKKIINKIKNSD